MQRLLKKKKKKARFNVYKFQAHPPLLCKANLRDW